MFCTLGTDDQVAQNSATLPLIFIQAFTSMQTVIHAGPRQRDVTGEQKKMEKIALTTLPSHT